MIPIFLQLPRDCVVALPPIAKDQAAERDDGVFIMLYEAIGSGHDTYIVVTKL